MTYICLYSTTKKRTWREQLPSFWRNSTNLGTIPVWITSSMGGLGSGNIMIINYIFNTINFLSRISDKKNKPQSILCAEFYKVTVGMFIASACSMRTEHPQTAKIDDIYSCVSVTFGQKFPKFLSGSLLFFHILTVQHLDHFLGYSSLKNKSISK